jgi:hypothetical protein
MAKGLGNKMMVFMSRRMIACDEASFLISLREDSHLGFKRWWQLKIHLLTCHFCRKYARQIGELSSSMEIYREQCGHDSCGKHLNPQAGIRIRGEVERGIHAK